MSYEDDQDELHDSAREIHDLQRRLRDTEPDVQIALDAARFRALVRYHGTEWKAFTSNNVHTLLAVYYAGNNVWSPVKTITEVADILIKRHGEDDE